MQQSEKALFSLAQTGDTEAEEQLLVRHMPLVHALSKRFPSWREDAFQSGCLALLHAIRTFDAERGYRFSTYAVPHVLGAMKKAGAERMPWRTRALLGRIRCAQEKVSQEEMRSATVEEMAHAAGVDRAEVALLLDLEQCFQNGEEALKTYADPQSDIWLNRFLLKDMISRLSSKERYLLHLRYREGRNQKEAACIMHTSQAGISRMENKIRETLLDEWME